MIRMAGSVSKSWLARQLGVAFDGDYYFNLPKRHDIDVRCNEYVERTLGDLDVFYTESNLGRREWWARDQVLVGGIQPNMIVGMLLGATFLPVADADADISAKCLLGRALESLPAPGTLLAHPCVRQWDAQIEHVRALPAVRWRPIPPFFWDASGRAAIHGPVTSGLKFYGDEFLMNLLSDPARSELIVNRLNEISETLVCHFADVGGLTVQSIHVGECAACMLDVASFRRFVVPATSRFGERFGAVRFHSCGCSDHLLEACGAITGLAELDVGGATSVERIRELFGPRFPVGIAPLVEDMRADSPHNLLRWYQRIERQNAGGELTIGFHLEADYRLENLRALARAVGGSGLRGGQ